MSEMPSGWVDCPFVDVVTSLPTTGHVVETGDYSGDGAIPVLTQGAADLDGFTGDASRAFRSAGPLIIFGDHTRAIKIGHPPFAVGPNAKVLAPSPALNAKFLFYQLPLILPRSRGYGRHYQFLAKTRVRLAPSAEQDRIVAAIEEEFSRLDAGMAALDRAQRNVEHMRAALIRAGLSGELSRSWREVNPDVEPVSDVLRGLGRQHLAVDDSEHLGAIPRSWKWVCWEAVLSQENGAFRRGPFGSALTKAIFVASGYKVYEQYCAINDDCSFGRYYITADRYQELQSFAVQAGDFLISCSGSLGRVTQVPAEYQEGVINQALLRVRLDSDVIDDAFFKLLVRSPYFQRQILANSTGTAMVNVKGVKELKAIPIPLPPVAEQGKIVALLGTESERCGALDGELEKASRRSERLRSAILNAAFSGRLIQQDPKDEPASILLDRITAEREHSKGHTPIRAHKQEPPERRCPHE